MFLASWLQKPAAGWLPWLLLAFVLTSIFGSMARAEDNVFQDAGKRVALVIGISQYENAPSLVNPTNDAGLIAKTLRTLKFDVIEVIDPSLDNIAEARRTFVDRLEGSDIAFFYYAGHAVQIDNINYIVPRDALFDQPATIFTQLQAVTEIIDEMDRLAKTKLIVLDACRNNPFEEILETAFAEDSQGHSVGRGLAAIDRTANLEKPESSGFNTYGSVIAFAAAPGKTATDGEGGNSPYTAALAREMVRPGVEVGQMFRSAAANVVKATAGEQRPEYLVRLTDEVFLSRPQPSDCDYFAIAPFNQVGIPGVEFDKIKPSKAIPSCQDALAEEPDHPRFLHNLGRAYDAAAQYDKAVEYYKKSADLGYVPAFSTLGVMNINGQGTEQNFHEGVKLLKHAAGLGYRMAKLALRNQDFTVLFRKDEFKRLQAALKTEGYYDGPVDGDFGPKSLAALRSFQDAHQLAANGGTLETLDALNLIDAIPHYELN
ncbi:caspase family protein [Rhizobium sp. L1K21]|uniref:caspase family protein n=1 Tax=Rhizobium sp. L1K21 TaxID=2954933 RepID=UPI002093D4B7|nr:caspase family protein [Rhizobium sp. L1K21]MCO6185954.1 caspase family protein [Rhizobium sp. L1K21]